MKSSSVLLVISILVPCIFAICVAPAQASPDPGSRVHFDAVTQTWQVEGCEFADVKSALLAAGDGQTVQLGFGHCDWGNDSSGNPQWVNVQLGGKSILLRGKGVKHTTIHRTTPIGAAEEPLIYFSCGASGTVEISDIRFVGNDDEQEGTPATRALDQDLGIQMNGRCPDFKLHDLVFEKFSSGGIMLRGAGYHQKGVIYDNKFISNYKCYPYGQPQEYDCLGYGVVLFGANDWPTPVWGGGDKVYIENNQFYDNRHAIAAHTGAEYVARRNKVLGSKRTAAWGMDAHGPKGNNRGTRSWEIYENLFGTEVDADSYTNAAQSFVPRGGDGIFANNLLQGRFGQTLRIMLESYPTDCYFPEGFPDEPPVPKPDQTTEAWIWGNEHDTREAFPDGQQNAPQLVTHKSGSRDCAYWFRAGQPDDPPEDWEYTLHPKPGWEPWTYPHPLRATGDRIYRDDFDWY